MAVRAFITGLAGTTLTGVERAFLREREPWGFILFSRNIDTPAQLSRLIMSVRDAVGREAPVLVDQEGGRIGDWFFRDDARELRIRAVEGE